MNHPRPILSLLLAAALIALPIAPVLADDPQPAPDASSAAALDPSGNDAVSTDAPSTESGAGEAVAPEHTGGGSGTDTSSIDATPAPGGGEGGAGMPVTQQATTTDDTEPTTNGESATATNAPASGEATDTESIPAPAGDASEATSTPRSDIATTSESVAGSATTTGAAASSTPTASGASGTTTTITTGTATAGASIVNVAAANFVNSSGEVIAGNYFGSSTGIDLRTATSAFATGGLCLLFACTGSDGVSVNLSGTSTLENLLALSAATGGNAVTNASSAAIATGDALVGLNLINLANLNVVDSRYLIAALNLFSGLDGDLVFPSLSGFFEALLSGTVPSSLTLNPQALVDNQINFTTDTGDNATNASSSAITTGAARSLGTILNQLNSSLLGGANLAILLRVSGVWNGDVENAPDGLSIIRGSDGSIYLTRASSAPAFGGNGVLAASTTALITNHADLTALTGGNGIFNADTARIDTGNALAAANVLTIANQNIIGRNWIAAIINIFGDWNGNLAFGRPDLWVGERVESPGALQDGSELTFHFTIANKGDAPASAATFAAALETDHLELLDGASLSRDLGTLPPGASVEVTYRARVHAEPGTDIMTSGTASARETDNNAEDNTDRVTLSIARPGGGRIVERNLEPETAAATTSTPTSQAPIVIRRTASVLVNSSRVVHEELSVVNPSDATSTPYDLHDLVKDAHGTIIDDEAWPLGTLAPHEEVTVTYDLSFAPDAPGGVYLLSTVLASDAAGDIEYRNNGSIVLLGAPAPLSVPRTGPVILHEHASSTGASAASTNATSTAVRTVAAPGSPLLAAVGSLPEAWPYAAGFAAAAAALGGVLASVLAIRRRYPGIE